MDNYVVMDGNLGWEYYADNNAGQTLIGNQVYIIDKNFENVLYCNDQETVQSITKYTTELKEASTVFRELLKDKGITIKDIQNKIDSLYNKGYTFEQIQEIGYGNLLWLGAHPIESCFVSNQIITQEKGYYRL